MSVSSYSSNKSSRGLPHAKILLVGDRRVGTTSILKRFLEGKYTDEYRPQTQDVVHFTQNVYSTRHKREVNVLFYDVEGADRANAMVCAQKAHSVGVVFDVTNRSSFETAQRLLDDISPRSSSLLIGTKVDLQQHRHVSHREGKLLARIHRLGYIEVSSLKNSNVEEAMTFIIDSIPDEYIVESDPEKRILATRAGLKHLQTQQKSSSDNALCCRCKKQVIGDREYNRSHSNPSTNHHNSHYRPPFDITHIPQESASSLRHSYVDEMATSSSGEYHVARRRQHYSDSEQNTHKPRVRIGSSNSNYRVYRY